MTAPTERPVRLSAPLLVTGFRMLVIAQFTANIGLWMHTVAAQWALTTSGVSSTLVASIQTALTMPFFVLALPAGLIADVADRRRLLVVANGLMAATMLGLTMLAAGSRLPPLALVSATVVLGAANTLSVIAWQSVIPELVDRRELPAAATLDGMSFNAARAAGPAVGGILLSMLGPASVFAVDMVVFIVAGVVCWVFAPRRPHAVPPRGVPPRGVATSSAAGALADGVRFVWHSSWMRRLLLRLVLFSFPAACLWALLPVITQQRLGLGAVGFGLLFGAVGAGAVLGPVAVQPVRRRLGTNVFIAVGSVAYAAGLVVVAEVRQPVVVGAYLVVVGTAWVCVQTTFMGAAQAVLPPWVRARALACVLLVHSGCQAFGAIAWGVLADHIGLSWAILSAGALMALGAMTVRGWGMYPTAGIEPVPISLWSQSTSAAQVDPDDGPVLVLVEYEVRPERSAEFLTALWKLAGSRRRLGATGWHVYRDVARPHLIVEAYVVRSWGQYVHQESVRWTTAEKRNRDAVETLTDRPVAVRRLVVADSPA